MTRRSIQRACNGCGGFTLIELLVAMVIIAIMISVTLLSLNVLGEDTQIADETRRLETLIGAAREQAEMQSRDVGLSFHTTGYEFMRYDARRDLWSPPTNDPLLRRREFPAGLAPRLYLDGHEIVLKPRQEPPKKPAKEKNKDADDDAGKEDDEDKPLPPQIFILANGDLTPFEFVLEREGGEHSVTLIAKADGSVDEKPVDGAQK